MVFSLTVAQQKLPLLVLWEGRLCVSFSRENISPMKKMQVLGRCVEGA